MNPDWIHALEGGLLIGSAVSLMLLLNGRVTGISGIIYGSLKPVRGDFAWRLSFIGGLLFGGLVLRLLNPDFFSAGLSPTNGTAAFAGLLVGFGTVLGSGCTSGHGICGLSRLSIRSIVATATFILSGIITVFLVKHLGGL